MKDVSFEEVLHQQKVNTITFRMHIVYFKIITQLRGSCLIAHYKIMQIKTGNILM